MGNVRVIPIESPTIQFRHETNEVDPLISTILLIHVKKQLVVVALRIQGCSTKEYPNGNIQSLLDINQVYWENVTQLIQEGKKIVCYIDLYDNRVNSENFPQKVITEIGKYIQQKEVILGVSVNSVDKKADIARQQVRIAIVFPDQILQRKFRYFEDIKTAQQELHTFLWQTILTTQTVNKVMRIIQKFSTPC